MTGRHCRYDPYLQLVNADRLKGMVRTWGGTSKLVKGECIAVIEAGLGDPVKVRAAIQNLDLWERNALAILKTFGNEIEAEVLNTAIWATGVKLPPRIQNPRWSRENALVEVLLSRGLVLLSEGNPGYFPSYSSSKVFTDERLTAEAGSLEVQSLEMVPVPTPEQTLYRRPPTVALDTIGLLQAISDLGASNRR